MSQSILYFQVDAFTQSIFAGNPAGVCLLSRVLDDQVLLQMAMEHHLAETAFVIYSDGYLNLRWFTPELEMDLCGHATLAAAHVLLSESRAKAWLNSHGVYLDELVMFQTQSGVLSVTLTKDELYTLDFPIRPPQRIDDWAVDEQVIQIIESLGQVPQEVWRSRDLLCVYDHTHIVESLSPDPAQLGKVDLGTGGVIVTAKSNDIHSKQGTQPHFISRFFTPQASLFEDYVTGSAHCTLGPFWSDRLGLKQLTAYQASSRGGWLDLQLHVQGESGGPAANRIWISGHAVTYGVADLRI